MHWKGILLTDVDGLSSLDFWALFFPGSGIFSGAPASKATPDNRGNNNKTRHIYNSPVFFRQSIQQLVILVLLFMQITVSDLFAPRLACSRSSH